MFNLLGAANHNQLTHNGANRMWKAALLELRSRQNARTMLLRDTRRFWATSPGTFKVPV